jgi:hypothetical protein
LAAAVGVLFSVSELSRVHATLERERLTMAQMASRMRRF